MKFKLCWTLEDPTTVNSMSKAEEAMMKNMEDLLRPSESDPSVNFEKSFHEIMICIQTLINLPRSHFAQLDKAKQI